MNLPISESVSDQSRKELITKACMFLMDNLESSVKEFRKYDKPLASDTIESIHQRLLFVSSVESDITYIYRQALSIKSEVEKSRANAKWALAEAQNDAYNRPGFKGIGKEYVSRPETEIKLRTLTINEEEEVHQWDILYFDVRHLVDTILSHKADAERERKNIDLRLKIINLTF